MDELVALRRQQLPVKVVVFSNGSLALVELEMKADGIAKLGDRSRKRSLADVGSATAAARASR